MATVNRFDIVNWDIRAGNAEHFVVSIKRDGVAVNLSTHTIKLIVSDSLGDATPTLSVTLTDGTDRNNFTSGVLDAKLTAIQTAALAGKLWFEVFDDTDKVSLVVGRLSLFQRVGA